jgi:hypothetical protein
MGGSKSIENQYCNINNKTFINGILIRFGCPLTIAIHQGVHFINDVIKHLTNHFLLKHVSFTTYNPQRNGHAKFTNKVFGTLLTKLVRIK